MAIKEFEMTKIGEEDGLLRVEMAGVCGTDPKIFGGEVRYGDLPLILGNEIVG